MDEMEFRARIEVPGLPVEEESRWQPLIERLESKFGDFGPVLSWEGDSVIVVISTQAVDRGAAARELFGAVAESLNSAGLTDAYPVSLEVENVGPRLTPA